MPALVISEGDMDSALAILEDALDRTGNAKAI